MTKLKPCLALLFMLFLAACGEEEEGRAPALPPPPRYDYSGLEQVIGHTARGLTEMFGSPDQDLREANGRRLQFGSGPRGGVCVLDAYLYSPGAGREAVVTYIETRLPDGRETDRARCVAALIKRRPGA